MNAEFTFPKLSNWFKFCQLHGGICVACGPLTPLFLSSPTLCSVLITPKPSLTSCLTIPPSCASSAAMSSSCSTAQIHCAGGDVAMDTWDSSRQNTSSLFTTASDPHLSSPALLNVSGLKNVEKKTKIRTAELISLDWTPGSGVRWTLERDLERTAGSHCTTVEHPPKL